MKFSGFAKKYLSLGVAALVAVQPLLASAQSAYQFRRYVPNLEVTRDAGAPINIGGGTAAPVPQPRLQVSAVDILFGARLLGTTQSVSVAVLNSGDASLSFVVPPQVLGSSAFGVSTNCAAQLSPGESCVFNVTFSPSVAGVQTAALQLQTNAGLQSINLSGTGIATALALSADSNGAFGNLTVGASTDLTVTARNVTSSVISGVYPQLIGPASLTIVSSSCGSTGSPISLAAGATCQAVVRWAPTQASSVNGAQLQLFGAFTNAPVAVTFSGSAGGFDAAGAWSSEPGSTVAMAGNTLHFGTRTAGATSRVETIFLRNTGNTGALTAAFRLEGDTEHFRIQYLRMATNNGDTWDCDISGAVHSSGLSTSECSARDPRNSPFNHIRIVVAYAPSAVGSHSVRLIATTTQGSVMPEPLVLTGTAEFNASGEWSTTSGSTVLSPPVDLGPVGVGTVTERTVYLRNSGAYGALSAGFSLTGDTSHYRIVGVGMVTNSGAVWSCLSGGVIAADGLSAQPCMTQNPDGGNGYSHIYVRVRYAPTTVGTHSVGLVASSTANGSALPPTPLMLSGNGIYNVNGVWSLSSASTTTPASQDLSFITTTGAAQNRTFILRNTGSNGALSAGFALSGDTAHYRITQVQMMHSDGTVWSCVSGGVIAADGLSSTPCTAQNTVGGNGYIHVRVTVRYQPQAQGTHTVSLVPSSPLPATLPAPLVLTGDYSVPNYTGGAPTNPPSTNIWAPGALTLSSTDFFTASRSGLGGGTSVVPLPSTGKWYFEVRFTGNYSLIGVGVAPATTYPGGYNGSCAYYPYNNSIYRNDANTGTNTGGGTTGNVVGVAWNADTKTATFSRGGLQGTRTCTLTQSGPFYAAVGNGSSSAGTTLTYIDVPSQFVNPVPAGYLVPNLRP